MVISGAILRHHCDIRDFPGTLSGTAGTTPSPYPGTPGPLQGQHWDIKDPPLTQPYPRDKVGALRTPPRTPGPSQDQKRTRDILGTQGHSWGHPWDIRDTTTAPVTPQGHQGPPQGHLATQGHTGRHHWDIIRIAFRTSGPLQGHPCDTRNSPGTPPRDITDYPLTSLGTPGPPPRTPHNAPGTRWDTRTPPPPPLPGHH